MQSGLVRVTFAVEVAGAFVGRCPMPRQTNPVPVAGWRPAGFGAMSRSATNVRLPAVAAGPAAGNVKPVPGWLRVPNRWLPVAMFRPCGRADRGNVGTRGAPQ